MHVEFQIHKNTDPAEWQERFGASPRELADSILLGDYIPEPGPLHAGKNPQLIVTAKRDDGYALDFVREFDKRRSVPTDDPDRKNLMFSVIFDYKKQPGLMRLRDVFFTPCKGQGVGSTFLRRVMHTALSVDATQILVKPDADGSWFWPRNGAAIQNYPNRREQHAFYTRLNELSANPAWTAHWKAEDLAAVLALARPTHNTHLDPLHRIITRDDLFITRPNEKPVPLHQYLLYEVALDYCSFDMNGDYTKACLKQRLGFDVEAERARVAASRPPSSSAGKSPPAPRAG